MKKKLLLQDLAAYLATGSGLTRKESEGFARAFFDVIESGLLEDKFVKIKGFGTFKLIVVSERESVNVNTGERFQIGRHSKVSFTPEASLKELVNRPFAHFEAVDLNDETDVAELNSVDNGMAEEAAEAEDALPATEWAEEASAANEKPAAADAQETENGEPAEEPTAESEGETVHAGKPSEEKGEEDANTEYENSVSVSVVQNDIEAEHESLQAPTQKDEDEEETGADKEETGADEEKTDEDEEETDEASDIKVSPPTPISRGEQIPEEEVRTPRNTAAPTAPQGAETAAVPSATETATPAATESAAETPQQAAPQTQPDTPQTQPDTPQTQPNAAQNGTQGGASDIQSLNVAGGGAVSISYTETPHPAGHNWWKTATLTICVLILMTLSYFAGYFQLLCPCTFLGREVPPPALPSLRHTAPAPESRPAPAQTATPPANPADKPVPAAGTPAAKDAKGNAADGANAPAHGKDAGASDKVAAGAEGGKSAPAATAAPSAEKSLPCTHKVKAGDNLSRLSRRYYGSDKHIDFIIKTNKLRDADNIPLGSTLTFPPLPQSER